MRSSSCVPERSNRHNSTFSACAENSAKFTPLPSQVAPSGWGWPGHTFDDGINRPAAWPKPRVVGWVEQRETHRLSGGLHHDGFRLAQPILRATRLSFFGGEDH